MLKKKLKPIHPGEVLLEEFMRPMGISQYRLAKELHVTPIRISEIVNGKRAMTADTALRLARFFNMEAQFWLNLQVSYDLDMASTKHSKRYLQVRPFNRDANIGV